MENQISAVLKVVRDSGSREVFRSSDAKIVCIGRDPKVEICISDDPYVQPFHVQLQVNPPECSFMVMTGQPAVCLNGQLATQAILKSGDRITVGKTQFEFCSQNSRTNRTDTDFQSTLYAETLDGAANGIVHNYLTSQGPPTAPPGYRMGRCLGQGGMGVVYEATHLEDPNDFGYRSATCSSVPSRLEVLSVCPVAANISEKRRRNLLR